MSYISRIRFADDEKTIEMAALSLAGFMAPFMVHEQLFLGVFINALLARSAYSLPGRKTLAVIMAPSIGALMNGLIFGEFTVLLLYMMPVIWSGNALLVYVYKRGYEAGTRYLQTLLLASGLKAGLLFSFAWMLHSASILPAVFLTTMGVMQFVTASLGGVAAYLQQKIQD